MTPPAPGIFFWYISCVIMNKTSDENQMKKVAKERGWYREQVFYGYSVHYNKEESRKGGI
jgi:hypothetical protein